MTKNELNIFQLLLILIEYPSIVLGKHKFSYLDSIKEELTQLRTLKIASDLDKLNIPLTFLAINNKLKIFVELKKLQEEHKLFIYAILNILTFMSETISENKSNNLLNLSIVSLLIISNEKLFKNNSIKGSTFYGVNLIRDLDKISVETDSFKNSINALYCKLSGEDKNSLSNRNTNKKLKKRL